jgi:hypothetical protein
MSFLFLRRDDIHEYKVPSKEISSSVSFISCSILSIAHVMPYTGKAPMWWVFHRKDPLNNWLSLFSIAFCYFNRLLCKVWLPIESPTLVKEEFTMIMLSMGPYTR